jgi:hypothetical protein
MRCVAQRRGGMAEWLKALAWKACIRETVSWVRIPLPPPEPLFAAVRASPIGIFAVNGRRRLSETETPQRAANDLAPPRNADRQAFRSEAICGGAQALDRRA